MRTILSYGMGVESSALLIRWLTTPATCPSSLHDLIVISAQTGDEYEDTRRSVEHHILPLLRQHNIRYVQVARHGHLEEDGITVLSDTTQPDQLFIGGDYKLSDELRVNGTVPQYGGVHRCSLKAKVFPIESWLRDCYPYPALHAFGYNADETKRVQKSNAAEARRVAFGFNVEETKRIARTKLYDSPIRTSIFPLVEWGWTREDCVDYLKQQLGVVWKKSACVYCPFNRLSSDAIERHREHAPQVADALELEYLSLSLNPRGTLYPGKSLIQITEASGNQEAINLFRSQLDRTPWVVYRVRRIYYAAKDKSGRAHPEKKGHAIRAVEQVSEAVPKASALDRLKELALPSHLLTEQRGITYAYQHRCGDVYPTREEFLVAAPAVVKTKARYGLAWFEEQWDSAQGRLFE